MATRISQIGRLWIVVLAAIVAQKPAPLHAMETTIEDRKAENRIVVTLPASQASAAISALLGRAAVLHHFRIEILGDNGQVVDASAPFELMLSVGSTVFDRGSLVRLNQNTRDISLPKPLGYRVEATDSIHIVTMFASVRNGHVRLTISYEAPEGSASRLAVRSLTQVDADGSETSTTRSWSWKAETSGRMLAIAGAALEGAKGLELRDVETGDVLWRAVIGQATRAQRLGIVVQAGRVYKLIATYSAPTGAGTSESMLALALPGRTQ